MSGDPAVFQAHGAPRRGVTDPGGATGLAQELQELEKHLNSLSLTMRVVEAKRGHANFRHIDEARVRGRGQAREG